MPIRRKSSIDKKYYESIGQGILFGHDNLLFKTVYLPRRQRMINLCNKFGLKLIKQTDPVILIIVNLS